MNGGRATPSQARVALFLNETFGYASGMPVGKERLTIADVARSAGVSVPTVSKVLNGRSDVSTATRDRVQQALSTSGYRRRGSSERARSGLIDLVITSLDTPYATELLVGAEAAAARAGVGLVVSALNSPEAADRRWLNRLAARRSGGLIFVVSRPAPTILEHLAQLGTPMVLLDPVGGSDPSLPTVGATNFAGGVAATEHLIGLGHRRIACITGLPYLICSQERLEGWRAALHRAGMTADEGLVRHGDFTPSGGQQAAMELLSLTDRPTAIFAGSDMQASGVYHAARSLALSVPDDVSVVGFDDLSVCRYMSPRLTTIRQPLSDMATEAVRMVLELAEDGSDRIPPHLQLATSLVVRESTGPVHR